MFLTGAKTIIENVQLNVLLYVILKIFLGRVYDCKFIQNVFRRN